MRRDGFVLRVWLSGARFAVWPHLPHNTPQKAETGTYQTNSVSAVVGCLGAVRATSGVLGVQPRAPGVPRIPLNCPHLSPAFPDVPRLFHRLSPPFPTFPRLSPRLPPTFPFFPDFPLLSPTFPVFPRLSNCTKVVWVASIDQTHLQTRSSSLRHRTSLFAANSEICGLETSNGGIWRICGPNICASPHPQHVRSEYIH